MVYWHPLYLMGLKWAGCISDSEVPALLCSLPRGLYFDMSFSLASVLCYQILLCTTSLTLSHQVFMGMELGGELSLS